MMCHIDRQVSCTCLVQSGLVHTIMDLSSKLEDITKDDQRVGREVQVPVVCASRMLWYPQCGPATAGANSGVGGPSVLISRCPYRPGVRAGQGYWSLRAAPFCRLL